MFDNNKPWNDGAYLKAAVLEPGTREMAEKVLEYVDTAEQYLKWAEIFADKTGTYDFTLGELYMLVGKLDKIDAHVDHIAGSILSVVESVWNARGKEFYLRISEERRKISEIRKASATSNDPTQTAE